MASEWDGGTTFSAPQRLFGQRRVAAPGQEDLTRDQARRLFRDFIRNFRRDGIFIYRDALRQNYENRAYCLEVELGDLRTGPAEALHDYVLKSPNEYLPMMEMAARDVLEAYEGESAASEGGAATSSPASSSRRVPPIQVLITGDMGATQIREVTAGDVNKLVMVPGIVINASRTRSKAIAVTIRCRNCNNERELVLNPGFTGVAMPRRCTAQTEGEALASEGGPQAKCPPEPYLIISERCRFVDQQTLKLQEAPETVPTGEMPRHMLLAMERSLADRITPGTRINAFGVVSVFTSSSGRGEGGAARGGGGAVRTPYLRVVGVMVQTEGGGRATATFNTEETQRLVGLSRSPRMYERLSESIAPSISGDYTTDIKRAILCLLLAGSRKVLPDGMKLRGDINVLMLGDPSTAKSQFLKFVEKVAPVGVYTSGKGSSAAGLTASVIKDSRGEFYLEGGAMVLADGGVVCIDEFDKMREEDRVAIHEAMEQQTISVAKAGITTILNSRAAVLAAANPVFGRYDDTRSAADNIDLLPTILSRFDLIFIVRDVRNERRDQEIARHVMNVHINASADTGALDAAVGGAATAAAGGDIDIATLKRYITFARAKCAPRLSDEAARFLQSKYVEIRKEAKGRENDAREAALATSEERSVIPITVRQLEALVRITEAVAKATLSREATVAHAEEALRLFRVSTLNAAASGLSTLEGNMSEEGRRRIVALESRIQRMVPVGASLPASLVRETLIRAGFEDSEVHTALRIMERREEIALVNERRTLRRLK